MMQTSKQNTTHVEGFNINFPAYLLIPADQV